MRNNILLAAVLLAGGIGAAAAQTNAPQLNAPARTATTTEHGPGAPTVTPSNPAQTQNPQINPSAAGTQMGKSANSGTTALKKAEGQGGSKEINANTHPMTALKARKQMKKNGQQVQNRPRQTTEAGAGR